MLNMKLFVLSLLAIQSFMPRAYALDANDLNRDYSTSKDQEDDQHSWIEPLLIIGVPVAALAYFLIFHKGESPSLHIPNQSQDILHIPTFKELENLDSSPEILRFLKSQITRTRLIAKHVSKQYPEPDHYFHILDVYGRFVRNMMTEQPAKYSQIPNIQSFKYLGFSKHLDYLRDLEINGKKYYSRSLEGENCHLAGGLQALAAYLLQEALREVEPDLYSLIPKTFLAKLEGKIVVLQEALSEVPIHNNNTSMNVKNDNSIHRMQQVLQYFKSHEDKFLESILVMQGLAYFVGDRDLEPRNVRLHDDGFKNFDYSVAFDPDALSGIMWCFSSIEDLSEDDEYIFQLNPFGRLLPSQYSDTFMRALKKFDNNKIQKLLRSYMTQDMVDGVKIRRAMMLLDYESRQNAQ